MDSSPLDDPIWNCLNGSHRAFAEGDGLARRYRRGFPPLGAIAKPTEAAYEALAALVAPDEPLGIGSPEIMPRPPGWIVEEEATVQQMVCAGPVAGRPAPAKPVVLGDTDIPAMLALTELTHPGPFGPLTHRLGRYLGIKVDGRLVAMAGERFALPGFREISAVCTHPDWQGRGFARLLMTHLVADIYGAGLVPFLHVLTSNTAATLYERLGFRQRRTFLIQMLRRAPA